jgi:hypothetical protein
MARRYPTRRRRVQSAPVPVNGGLLGSEYRAAVDELVARPSHTPAVAQIESRPQRATRVSVSTTTPKNLRGGFGTTRGRRVLEQVFRTGTCGAENS